MSSSNLHKFKKLFHGQEIQDLENKINRLQSQINSQNKLITFFNNDFDKFLEKKCLENKNKISKSLGPIVTETIGLQMENERDQIIDALYPSIGVMITRYIRAAFKDYTRRLNKQIESKNLLKTFSRKIKAKQLNVSVAELMLIEQQDTRIFSIYLIDGSNGLIISSSESTNLDYDEDLFAGALTAIKDFSSYVGDKKDSLRHIEYGDLSINIETAKRFYIAAVTDTHKSEEVSQKLRTLLSWILKNYLDTICKEELSISDNSSINNITKVLDITVQKSRDLKQNSIKKHSRFNQLLIIFGLTIVFAIPFYSLIQKNLIKNIAKKAGANSFNINGFFWDREITGLSTKSKINVEILNLVSKNWFIKNSHIKSDIEIINFNKPPLITELNSLYNKDLTHLIQIKKLNKMIIINGYAQSKKQIADISNELLSKFSDLKVIDNSKLALDIYNTKISFKKNSWEVNLVNKNKLNKISDFIKKNPGLILILIAENDPTGSPELNSRLRIKREMSLKSEFMNKGHKPDNILGWNSDSLGTKNSFNYPKKFLSKERQVNFFLYKAKTIEEENGKKN